MPQRYVEKVDRENELRLLKELLRRGFINSYTHFDEDALFDAEVETASGKIFVEFRVRTSGGGKPMTSTSYPTVIAGALKNREACKKGLDNYRFIVQYVDRCVAVRFASGLSEFLGTQHDRPASESYLAVELPLDTVVELWKGTVCIHKKSHLR